MFFEYVFLNTLYGVSIHDYVDEINRIKGQVVQWWRLLCFFSFLLNRDFRAWFFRIILALLCAKASISILKGVLKDVKTWISFLPHFFKIKFCIAEGSGVNRLQEAALSQLESYLEKEGRDRSRFPRLLLLLSPLSSLSASTIEDLFFSGIIGNIKIPSVIPYILQMEQTDTSSSEPTHNIVPSPPPSPPNQSWTYS